MGSIIKIDFTQTDDRYRAPIINAEWEDPTPAKKKHAAEPLKDTDDIRRVCEHLLARCQYRNYLLFTCGINFGFRCGDLLQLKWGHFFHPNGTPKDSITLQEDKTNKRRTVYINKAVMSALKIVVSELVKQQGGLDLDSYVFRSESNRCKSNQPLDVKSVERILKDVINDELGIDIKAGTHCMRKTFGYHVVMSARDRSRALELLSKMLNHSSIAVTMCYIGITDDEIRATYENLNLGLLDPGSCIQMDVAV